MRERLEQILKIVCIGLALLLLVQLVKAAIHMNPLAGVRVPALPSLPADTNAVVKVANKEPGKPGTNMVSPPGISKTNAALASSDTNAAAPAKIKEGKSNALPVQVSTEQAITNRPGTNVIAVAETNTAVAKNTSNTNVTVATAATVTNLAAVKADLDTNAAGKIALDGNTNVVTAKTNKSDGTNSVAKSSRPKNPDMPLAAMMGGPGGKKAAAIAPDVQARVDRVTESEILAPVMHPMPMALLGIAGNTAFLRSPSGQTGLVKEGDELGEIKLLRIGTNRVLVEQDGQKKELMIFAGFGGGSLLPKSTDTPDETTKK